jgi:hypothetical protein
MDRFAWKMAEVPAKAEVPRHLHFRDRNVAMYRYPCFAATPFVSVDSKMSNPLFNFPSNVQQCFLKSSLKVARGPNAEPGLSAVCY